MLDKEKGLVAINKKQDVLFKPFLFDNTIDAFSYGLMRIEENKKIGFANTSDKVVIPPVYNFALSFEGNFAYFYHGGKYTCPDKNVTDSDCEHASWQGGSWGIINRNNDTVIAPGLPDAFLYDIDLSTLTTIKPESFFYIPVQGKNQMYYAENVRLRFNAFLKNFVKEIENQNQDYLKSITFSNIECAYCLLNTKLESKKLVKDKKLAKGNYFTGNRAEEILPISKFLTEDFNLVFNSKAVTALKDTLRTDVSISRQNFNSHHFNLKGAFFRFIKPQKSYYWVTVIVSYPTKNKIDFQDHFSFIKIGDEIKLIATDHTEAGYNAYPYK